MLVLLSLLPAALVGAQTIYGPGGLIVNPTAYMDHAGLFNINASLFNRQLAAPGTTTFYPISATYAFTDRFELGGVYLGRFDGPTHSDQAGVFIKQGLLTEAPGRPAVAIVGTSLQGGGNESSLTMVASKQIVRGFRLHLGARGFNDTGFGQLDGNGIIGADFDVGRRFRVLLEADSRMKENPAGAQAYGLQYRSPQFTTTVGFLAQATTRFSFFVGIGFPITRP